MCYGKNFKQKTNDRVPWFLIPAVVGEGIRLFGKSTKKAKWNLKEIETFDEGLKILTYDLTKQKY